MEEVKSPAQSDCPACRQLFPCPARCLQASTIRRWWRRNPSLWTDAWWRKQVGCIGIDCRSHFGWHLLPRRRPADGATLSQRPKPAPDSLHPHACCPTGKMDAKKRLEGSVATAMSSNIVQCMGAMLDTVVF